MADGMMVSFELNDERVVYNGPPDARLLDVLRHDFALTGSKEGCGEGECGACTVLLDDEPVLSCLIPAGQCEGRRLQTVEWVAEHDAELVDRMTIAGGIQCGACTPGIVVTLFALRQRAALENAQPTRDDVRMALAGNLCRCTGYEGIFRALEPEEAPRAEDAADG